MAARQHIINELFENQSRANPRLQDTHPSLALTLSACLAQMFQEKTFVITLSRTTQILIHLFCGIFGAVFLLLLARVLVEQERRAKLIIKLPDTPDSQLREKVQELFENEFGVERDYDEEEKVGFVYERGSIAELRKMARMESDGWESVRAVAGICEKRRFPPHRSYSLCEGRDF